jgi:hypothetical protein
MPFNWKFILFALLAVAAHPIEQATRNVNVAGYPKSNATLGIPDTQYPYEAPAVIVPNPSGSGYIIPAEREWLLSQVLMEEFTTWAQPRLPSRVSSYFASVWHWEQFVSTKT